MSGYAVYAAEALDAARALRARAARNRLGVFWFSILFAGSVWLTLRLVEIAQTIGLPAGLDLTPGTLLFIAFFVALGKGAVDAYHRAIRPDALVFLLAQPMARAAVAFGKFLAVLWFNLAFVAGAFALAVAFVASGMRVPLDAAFAAGLLLAVVAGLASGFTLAVLGSQASWRGKAVGLASYAPVVALVYAGLSAADPTPSQALGTLLPATAASFVGLFASSPFLLGAWNNQTSGRRREGGRRPYLRFRDPLVEALVDLELKTAVRKRQFALTVATLVLLGAALLGVYATVGFPTGIVPAFAVLFYPIVVTAGAYVAAATQIAVPGMAALGKELDRLWILKSSPVPGTTVYAAKAIALVLPVPLILAVVVLPLPVVAGFPWDVTLLLALIALSIAFLLAALGLRLGARSPNFDPNTGGLPDSIGLYNVFLVALALAFFLAIVPGGLFQADRVLGILAAALLADLAALAAVLAGRGAAGAYEALER